MLFNSANEFCGKIAVFRAQGAEACVKQENDGFCQKSEANLITAVAGHILIKALAVVLLFLLNVVERVAQGGAVELEN